MRSGWNEVELNGTRQWVSIRGDAAAPLLLFLHGGPGGAEYGPRRHYLGRLERMWRVVDWEQRGAGRSFTGRETSADLSLDVLVADGLALSERLREAHPGRPIVILGHSFGTVLGVLMASRAPELFAAYVGAAQVVDWAEQERRSYDWALGEARKTGAAKAVAALEAIGRPAEGVYASGTRGIETQRRWLGSLGGVAANPRFLLRWMLSILARPEYPLRTKLRFTGGMRQSMDLLWPELGQRVRFSRDIARLEVPVHVFAGGRDRITSVGQVRPWFDALDAPSKRMEVVDGVGHLGLYEAPERFVAFMDAVRLSLDDTVPTGA